MLSRLFVFVLAAALVWPAAKKSPAPAAVKTQDLILNITIYGDPESVKETVGDDLGGHYVVAQVNVQPKYGKEIVIDRDDFFLRTDSNGERTRPMAPNQIAGKSALVLTQTRESLGQNSEPRRGWSIRRRTHRHGQRRREECGEAKSGKAATMKRETRRIR